MILAKDLGKEISMRILSLIFVVFLAPVFASGSAYICTFKSSELFDFLQSERYPLQVEGEGLVSLEIEKSKCEDRGFGVEACIFENVGFLLVPNQEGENGAVVDMSSVDGDEFEDYMVCSE